MDLAPILKLWEGLGGSTVKTSSIPALEDRYRGVLLGVAAGNLLGIPVEGMSSKDLREIYPQGLRDISPQEKTQPWDDDLAQTVLLAEALLAGNRLSLGDLGERLLRWALENGRGMGNLTRRVLRELDRGTPATEAARLVWEQDGRQPAGNGAVMRCAPVALRWRQQPQVLVKETLESAKATHYDPRCQWSAVAVNIALAHILEGRAPELSALAAALDRVGAPTAVTEAIRASEPERLEDLALDDRHTMGYTLRAMQAGLWALMQPSDFAGVLVRVVNAGGDTDTNGAVAGAILGAKYGVTAIPQRWLDHIPQRERIEHLATRLLRASEQGA